MEQDVKEQIGRRIREIRGELSQAEFAALLGVTQDQVSKWERSIHIPGGATLYRIKEVTGQDVYPKEEKEEGDEGI